MKTMTKSTSSASTLLAVSLLLVGFVAAGGGCSPTPPGPPAGCTSDNDCADEQVCNTDTGECVLNTNLFATVTFDHDFHGGAFDCTTCHHAGLTACGDCHNRDEVVNGIPTLKDAQHDPEQYGCWNCHDEEFPGGTRDCSVCHTDLNQP